MSMSNYACELFGHFIYADQLSYQELLDREAMLTRDTEEMLRSHQAEHLNYTPSGDELMLQCVFKEYDVDLFHDVCEALSPLLCQAVQGRLLFVDKHLGSLHMYALTEMGWHEATLCIPPVSASSPQLDPPLVRRGGQGKKKAAPNLPKTESPV